MLIKRVDSVLNPKAAVTVENGISDASTTSRFEKPNPIEYPEFFREGMGTENVGPLLRSFVQMLRPYRILEIGAGYTTPFLLEGLVNNERVFNDGNLEPEYFRSYKDDPKLVIIDDMSLGELRAVPGMEGILNSKYVELEAGRFQGKAKELALKHGSFDFVWYDCGGPPDYEIFMEEFWPICSRFVFFHFTYREGKPNKNMEIILRGANATEYRRLDIVEPHKRRQGSVTVIEKLSHADDVD